MTDIALSPAELRRRHQQYLAEIDDLIAMKARIMVNARLAQTTVALGPMGKLVDFSHLLPPESKRAVDDIDAQVESIRKKLFPPA